MSDFGKIAVATYLIQSQTNDMKFNSRVDAYIAQGMSPEEATAQAQRDFNIDPNPGPSVIDAIVKFVVIVFLMGLGLLFAAASVDSFASISASAGIILGIPAIIINTLAFAPVFLAVKRRQARKVVKQPEPAFVVPSATDNASRTLPSGTLVTDRRHTR